jgi:hypothetical protein
MQMKILAVGMAIGLSIAAQHATAAFTCEQIKEKAIRIACIEDRQLKEKEEAAQAQNIKLEAEKKSKADAEQKRKGDFVKAMQDLLTVDFKDPLSAQFTDLAIAEGPNQVLCGKVNAKNSYGGYVGRKSFFVRIANGVTEKNILTPPEGDSYDRFFEREKDAAKLVCEGTTPYP